MVEQVTNRKLYQVTATTAYKLAFSNGQKITIGDDHTPFFKFYETTLQYPVTDSNTGQLEQVNAVDWLNRVRNGTIQTAPATLATIAWEISQHYMMLARELMEQIRVDEFGGQPPSRQRCLYASETVEEAKSWLTLLGGNGVVCELTCTGTIHRADSRLMVMLSEPLSLTKDKARAYWRGERSADPRMKPYSWATRKLPATACREGIAMDTLKKYLEFIVEPTFQDFEVNRTSTRHAYLACNAA